MKRLNTDIAQGHPMDLFLKISHCSSGKCLLEVLLGRKIIHCVWGDLMCRIAAMGYLSWTTPPPPPAAEGVTVAVRSHPFFYVTPPSPPVKVWIFFYDHAQTGQWCLDIRLLLGNVPVSQVAECRCTLLAGNSSISLSGSEEQIYFSQQSPKMLNGFKKLYSCFVVVLRSFS